MAAKRQRESTAAIAEPAGPAVVGLGVGEPIDSSDDGGDCCTRVNEVVRAVEGWARQELRQCAVALRKLAYSQPNGIGEGALLRLSEQMNTAAGKGLADIISSVQPTGTVG